MYLYFKNNEPNLYFYNDYIQKNVTSVDDLFLQNSPILKDFSIECIDFIPDSKFLYPLCFGNFEFLDLNWVKFIDKDVIKCVKNKKAKILLISLENEVFFDQINLQISKIVEFWDLDKNDIICLVNNGSSHSVLNCFSLWIDEFEMFINNKDFNLDVFFDNINHYFESLTNNDKEHRYKLSKKIFEKSISCCLSYNQVPEKNDGSNFYYSLPKENSYDIVECFATNKKINETPSHLLASIHIVNETFDDNDTNSCSCPLTEKTLKPIIVGRPFIINGPVNAHQYLEYLGYKKHNFIDYTFDSVRDGDERIECLWREILRLQSIPFDELMGKIKKELDIIQYNRDIFEKRSKEHIDFIKSLENF